MFEQLGAFVKNPMGFLAAKKLGIPAQYANDPNQAINYLMNSGKLSQEQYGQAMQELANLQRNGQMPNPNMYFGSNNPR